MAIRRPHPTARGLGRWSLPITPSIPAAHGCLSAAITATLESFFGSDEVCFAIDSNVTGLLSPVRSYARFSDALEEVLNARIYGGMHYRNSTRVGARLGKQVSRYMTRHLFAKPGQKGHAHDD